MCVKRHIVNKENNIEYRIFGKKEMQQNSWTKMKFDEVLSGQFWKICLREPVKNYLADFFR